MTDTMQTRRGERGMALILAIAFLGILSIIGAVVIRYASQGMVNASKVAPEKRVFNVADRAVEYALNRDIIVALAGRDPAVVTIVNDIPRVELHTPANRALINVSLPGHSTGIIEGTVDDLGPGDLPAGAAGLFGSDFSANYYQVQVKVGAPAPTYDDAKTPPIPDSYKAAIANKNVTVTHVNASIVRLFKLDDDTIFRTSGGG
jgi:hypothetical protein